MKIFFIVPYPTEGPSNRFRVEQYFPYLEKQGIEFKVRPFISSGFYKILYKKGYNLKKTIFFTISLFNRFIDLVRLLPYDVIFIHRESCSFGLPVFEWIISKMKKHIIYDFDDAIFLKNISPSNKFLSLFKYPGKVKKIIKMSDHIIVSNKYLENYAKKFNPKVSVIPTPIDTEKFLFDGSKNLTVNKNKIVIGWIGSSTTATYLRALYSACSRLSEKYDYTFKIVGAGVEIDLPGVDVENKEWRLEGEYEDYKSLDIGVYPLLDDEWAKGKAGFKAICYMAAGVPCVASPVGVNKEIIEDGVNGFLANTEEEWIEKLSFLIENPVLCEKVGLAGRKTVEERYSVKVNAPRYLEVLQSVYRKTRRRR